MASLSVAWIETFMTIVRDYYPAYKEIIQLSHTPSGEIKKEVIFLYGQNEGAEGKAEPFSMHKEAELEKCLYWQEKEWKR